MLFSIPKGCETSLSVQEERAAEVPSLLAKVNEFA
jgi:hypothetical protein